MHHIENLQIRKWYVLMTPETSLTGMPVKIVSLNPPFVLVTDVDRDMMVIDTRVHTLSVASPNFLKNFRKLWKEMKDRRQRKTLAVCEHCGEICAPVQEENQ